MIRLLTRYRNSNDDDGDNKNNNNNYDVGRSHSTHVGDVILHTKLL
jgi:hypothetical protein